MQEARAIDVFEGYNTLLLDLNKDDLPEQFLGSFDLVTNFGSSEHVTNQLNCFKVVHDALKIGGIAFHQVPFTGYFNHGLIKYEPRFFFFLALANDYSIINWNLGQGHFSHRIPKIKALPGSENWCDIEFQSGQISMLLQKTKKKEFECFSDEDLRFVNKDMPADIRELLQLSV